MNPTTKRLLSALVPDPIWAFFRKLLILRRHKQVAETCKKLINEYLASPINSECKIHALKELKTEKIIWQYWAQGYDDVPKIVRECLDSVNQWAEGFVVIRLDDSNIKDYLVLPDFINEKRQNMSRAYFSDLLRLCVLSVYGGLWLDATVYLSGPIPNYIFDNSFFLYQRDSEEKNKRYWEGVYAYYFGWAKGYRVNMLSSIFYAAKDAEIVTTLCNLMLFYWQKGNTAIPDYFFLQILFDVLIHDYYPEKNCPLISDCIPHLLQQSMNDSNFHLACRDDVLSSTTIHKLTYKSDYGKSICDNTRI